MSKQSALSVLLALLVVTLGSAFADEPPREKVLGIGGLFIKAENPERLAKWYQENFGISLAPKSQEQKVWRQEAGPTVFATFNKDTKYFGRPEQTWMINFRVANLKAMVGQLRAAGITVEEPKTYPNGDFARLQDPEGNPVELWEEK